MMRATPLKVSILLTASGANWLSTLYYAGTHVECQYALSTFGIPRVALPVNTNGDLSTVFHMAWLQKRREIEEIEPIPFSYFSQRDTSSDIAQSSITALSQCPPPKVPHLISAASHNANGFQNSDPRSSDILVSV